MFVFLLGEGKHSSKKTIRPPNKMQVNSDAVIYTRIWEFVEWFIGLNDMDHATIR